MCTHGTMCLWKTTNDYEITTFAFIYGNEFIELFHLCLEASCSLRLSKSTLVTRQAINQSKKPVCLKAQAHKPNMLEVLNHMTQCCRFAHLFDWNITFLILWFSSSWPCGTFLTDPKYCYNSRNFFLFTSICNLDYPLINLFQCIFDKFYDCECLHLGKHIPSTLKLIAHETISCLPVHLRITDGLKYIEHLWSTSLYHYTNVMVSYDYRIPNEEFLFQKANKEVK